MNQENVKGSFWNKRTFSILNFVLLLLGFPLVIPLIAAAFVGFYAMMNGFGQMETMVQQMVAGIRPASVTARANRSSTRPVSMSLAPSWIAARTISSERIGTRARASAQRQSLACAPGDRQGVG